MFRTKHKVGKKKQPVYAIRDKKGKFKDIQSISKAAKGERRRHAKTKVRSGQGFRGDTV